MVTQYDMELFDALKNKNPLGVIAPRTHAKELAAILGMPERDARRRVEQARRAGMRILGDERGYWIAENDAEYQEFRRRYTAPAKQIMKTARMMDKADYPLHYGKKIGAKS